MCPAPDSPLFPRSPIEQLRANLIEQASAAKQRVRRFTGALALSAALCVLSALATLSSASLQAAPARSAPTSTVVETAVIAQDVAAIGMVVDDMDRSIAFYRDVLSFKLISDVEVTGESLERLQGVFGLRLRIVTMQLGNERIELTEYLVPKGRPYPADSRSNDHWFQHIAIITNDMDRAYAWLRQNKVRHASTGPQLLPQWNKNAGGISAFYFRDPDGHVLEILQFPSGKGNPKWHQARAVGDESEQLFLGIDHTAIVVADTDQSLRFYRDVLGMDVAGTSENYGTEQEHLNNVFGARLRITSLRPRDAIGPSIEFLEYLAPSDGRPYPAEARSNDLLAWQTTMVTDDIQQVVAALDAVHVTWISPGVIATSDSQIGFRAAALVRDPDGHLLRLVER